MSFSTPIFLFVLLPLAFVLYGAASLTKNVKVKNFVLLVISIVFYGWCGVQYLLLLFVLIGLNFFCTQKMQSAEKKKTWLVASLLLNIIVLGFF